MGTKEAIEYVMEFYNISSFYRLSKLLSDNSLTVQPIQLSRYMKGAKMSRVVAFRFFVVFEIVITDISYEQKRINVWL